MDYTGFADQIERNLLTLSWVQDPDLLAGAIKNASMQTSSSLNLRLICSINKQILMDHRTKILKVTLSPCKEIPHVFST